MRKDAKERIALRMDRLVEVFGSSWGGQRWKCLWIVFASGEGCRGRIICQCQIYVCLTRDLDMMVVKNRDTEYIRAN